MEWRDKIVYAKKLAQTRKRDKINNMVVRFMVPFGIHCLAMTGQVLSQQI